MDFDNQGMFSPNALLEFCWVISSEGSSIHDAIKRECLRLGLPAIQTELVKARVLDAVFRLRLRELRVQAEFRDLVLGKGELSELRIDFGSTYKFRALRLYLHLLQDKSKAAGLLLRFKRLDGDNAQIRAWQNLDIESALRILKIAKARKFQICLPMEDQNE